MKRLTHQLSGNEYKYLPQITGIAHEKVFRLFHFCYNELIEIIRI